MEAPGETVRNKKKNGGGLHFKQMLFGGNIMRYHEIAWDIMIIEAKCVAQLGKIKETTVRIYKNPIERFDTKKWYHTARVSGYMAIHGNITSKAILGLALIIVTQVTQQKIANIYLAILCDLFGMVNWPFNRLSDLQLRD